MGANPPDSRHPGPSSPEKATGRRGECLSYGVAPPTQRGSLPSFNLSGNTDMPRRNTIDSKVVFSNTQLDLFAAEQGIQAPPRVRLLFTSAMQQRLTPELEQMILRALREFPEFDGTTLTIGLTRANLGVAIKDDLTIRLNPHRLSHNTIGHELMHLLQGGGAIPGGEVQCDIWTLARSPLFLDDPPTYLSIGTKISENWPQYARRVRELCIAAIAWRGRHPRYIQWLKRELRILARAS